MNNYNQKPWFVPYNGEPKPLRGGAFGRIIVEFFEKNLNKEPVKAETLTAGLESCSYKLTFADGSVGDYEIHFVSRSSMAIASVSPITKGDSNE